MKNLIAHTFDTLARKDMEKIIMDYQSREKHCQELAGRMAHIAHWALMELFEAKPGESTRDQAEEYMREVTAVLPMDEEDE